MRPLACSVLLALVTSCSSSNGTPDAGLGTDAALADGGPRPDTGSSPDAGSTPDTGPLADSGPGATRPIGEWSDAPGACPAGSTRVDITTVQEMEDASRGDAHPEGTCFFVHDGTYTQNGSTLLLYVQRSDVTWVGESRTGVVLHGRATVEQPHVTISNMTFDLTGYAQSGSFNTLTILADDVTVSHVTLTGDCMTGLRGGHIEVDGGVGPVRIEACIVERFGQCTGDGHLDHGIYLAAGHDITIVNNVIRENSSRGIQLNTEGGTFGTLSTVDIEQNRIYANGHRDYEDGIVVNGSGTGDVTGLTVRHNLFYRNFYSGIRFTGDVISAVVVDHNTFVDDGMASSASGRSEINLDGGTPTGTVSGNVFVPERTVINECAGALSLMDNVVMGDASGACVTATTSADPMFTSPGSDDYHTGNAAVASYGAYGD